MSSVEQAVKKLVDDKITTKKIVVFSKTYCPFSKRTKAYFADNYPKETIDVVELDEHEYGSQIQDYLLEKTGARSVPRTFINGESVGGNDDLHRRPKEEIKKLIEKPH